MFRRKPALDGLEQDIRDHIDREAQVHIDRGMSPVEARRLAMMSFGNINRVREDVRAVWTWRLLDEVRQDLQYALRALRRKPLFVVAAVLTLALGVGVNTAMFAVVHAVLLRPLPYPAGERLVQLTASSPSTDGGPPRRSSRITVGELMALRESLTTLSHVSFVVGPSLMTATGWGTTTRLQGLQVAPNYFSTLGVKAQVGRTFGADEEVSGGAGVLVLSHRTWHTHFGGERGVIGDTLTLANSLTPNPAGESRRYVIVGVMPEGFDAANAGVEFWLPAEWNAESSGSMIGRLADTVALPAAETELDARLRALRHTGPEVQYELRPALENLVEPIRVALFTLAGAASCVLLIACVNVSHLLLTRMGERQRELTIRRALGAGRVRIARQLLGEALLLSLFGGVAGAALAWVGIGGLRALATTLPRIDLGVQPLLPRLEEVTADGTVLAFAALSSIVAGVLFGVVPAIRHSSPRRGMAFLRESTPGAQSGFQLFGRSRTRATLVLTEIALATVLLVGAGLMFHSFAKLSNVDPGFDATNVLTFQVALPAERYPLDRVKTFSDDLVARLNATPGTVAAYGQLPMVIVVERALWRSTPTAPATFERGGPEIRLVSERYLTVMGIPVVSGRGFRDTDREGAPRVLLINESLARSAFPGQSPLGARVFAGPDSAPWEIVGVTRDVRQLGLDRPAGPQVFALVGQWPGSNAFPLGPYFSVRSQRPDSMTALASIRAVTKELEADAGVFNVATMEQIVSNHVSRPRLYAALLGVFGMLAGVLALVGIYGVLSYAVSQRTREIGIRMALGARSADVLRLVLAQSALVAGCGMACGLAAAAVLTEYMRGMLFGIEPLDVSTFAVVTVCFAGVSAAASILPARRATKVNPLTALRWE